MQFIKRQIEDRVVEYFQPNKVVALLGLRRVGKTILSNKFFSTFLSLTCCCTARTRT
jgi:predicted AAA+ superfamily ATPase